MPVPKLKFGSIFIGLGSIVAKILLDFISKSRRFSFFLNDFQVIFKIFTRIYEYAN